MMRRALFSIPAHLGLALVLGVGAQAAITAAARAQGERAFPALTAAQPPALSQQPQTTPAVAQTSAADPWGPLISEASARFGVPELWLREVMRVESGGRTTLNGRPITSHAGAMGLMQVMPETYADLRARYALGADPYEPRSNVLAGAAYLREMFNRYGSASATFAAYNAGPGRYDDYRLRGRPLPRETVEYLARLGPAIAGPLPSGGGVDVVSLRLPSRPDEATSAARAPIFVRLGSMLVTPDLQQEGRETGASSALAPWLFVQSARLSATASRPGSGTVAAPSGRAPAAAPTASIVASAEPTDERTAQDALFVRTSYPE